MDFVIDWVSVGFISLGLVLFAVAYYIHRQTAKLGKAIARLYELNQQVNRDALDFFEQGWPILNQAGIKYLRAEIEWFGERRTECLGHPEDNYAEQSYEVATEDTRFVLTFCMPKYKGEKTSWMKLILTTYSQILQQDIEHKHAEVLASQKRLERYQLFVQHEVKNIAQFIQLLSEQSEAIEQDADKVQLFDRMHQSLPVMAERARNTIQQMRAPLKAFYGRCEIDLYDQISEVLQMYQLTAELKGHAQVQIACPVLKEVFKNLLGNYRDHGMEETGLQIGIQCQGDRGATVKIQSRLPDGQASIKPERLFEPFWTTSESGMGLGLFLTRELLKQVNSTVEFEQDAEKLCFTLELNNSA